MRRCIFSIVSVSPRWPCTWAQPVMPGLTLWRRDNGEIRSANASLRAIGCGRGPNNRHFAQQYIHQLGKLVDIRAPQNTANAHHRAHQGDWGPQAYRRICPSVEFWRISWPGVSTFPINTNVSALGGVILRPRGQGFDALS